MPAYNFQQQFAERILNGSKQHTVRLRRKHPTRVCQPLMLYTGMRTKQCKLIAEKTCTAVKPIWINPEHWAIHLNGQSLNPDEIIAFAHSDGFDDSYDFFRFFSDRYTGDQMDNDLEVIYWGMIP